MRLHCIYCYLTTASHKPQNFSTLLDTYMQVFSFVVLGENSPANCFILSNIISRNRTIQASISDRYLQLHCIRLNKHSFTLQLWVGFKCILRGFAFNIAKISNVCSQRKGHILTKRGCVMHTAAFDCFFFSRQMCKASTT